MRKKKRGMVITIHRTNIHNKKKERGRGKIINIIKRKGNEKGIRDINRKAIYISYL
jgi:hypothetical protein